MSRAFRRRIRQALADPALRSALDNNADRRQRALCAAFDATGDAENLRRRARLARQRSLDQLDELLPRFEERLKGHGVHVHHASDAAEACRIIVAIARPHGGTMVKSKSMVSEEIGLNHALEGAGLRPLETDLGEFLVQLRGETPSHIISPVVHLSREQAGATFERALGVPYTADVEEMTRTVRRVLRREFLQAEVGFSGVNFGVAETGTLCVVTNEGNARMATTLPPVHIALMGIERLVGTLDDLADLLAVLPRSATGQAITSYVTLIGGPRRSDDPDGPTDRHVVLLDNGRRAMRASPLSEALLCIRCGACLNACPVYREIGGHAYGSIYPGPIGAVLSSGLFGVEHYGDLAGASTLCGACTEVCPVGIDLSKLLLRARHMQAQSVSRPRTMRRTMAMYAWSMESPRRYRRAQRLGALALRLMPGRAGWVRALPPPLNAWTQSRHFPIFVRRTFADRWAQHRPLTALDGQAKGVVPRPAIEAPQIEQATIDRFGAAVVEAGGEFIACAESQAAERVAQLVQAAGATSVLAWQPARIEAPGVWESLRAGGVEVIEPGWGGREADRARTQLESWASAGAGLTGAEAALADTGTLVLTFGSGRPQLPSLLPWLHIAVVRAGDVYPSLADWLRGPGRRALATGRPAVLLTGPSRTADIEMTLTIGVHGPGRFVVVCVNGETPAPVASPARG